jgi:hypothetical protein
MDALARIWNGVPLWIRSVINVAVAGALTALVQYVIGLATPGDFNVNAAVDVVWVAVTTAVVRALNPLDTSYGVGKGE